MAELQKSKFSDDDLGTYIQRAVRRMKNHSGKWRKDARDDFNFYAGDQWDDDDEAKLKEALRPTITYNRVQPIVDSVSGTQVNNRQEVRFIPREQGDVAVSEVLTGAAEWVRDGCDAEDEETDAFLDGLICGMGWTETRVTYDEDPDGKLCIERVDPIEMYWDTASKKMNLADAREIGRLKDYDEEEAKRLWPGKLDEVAPQSGQWDDGWVDDEGESHFNDEIGYEGEEQDAGFDKDRRVYKVMEYQWWELETYARTLNPQTNEVEEVSTEALKVLEPYLEAEGIPVVRQQRRRYWKAFAAQSVILEKTPLQVQGGFTYQCITGKRDRNKRVWYGMVKAMKDPQRWANSFFSQILHVLNTNAKGGVIAEENAFVDNVKAETDWAAPDSIVFMRQGALSGAKPMIMPKPLGQYPEGTDRLMQFSLASFRDVTGVNMEMLGQADRTQVSGVLEYQRKEAALTVLAPAFDSLRRYRKRQGRLVLEYIQEYLSDGRLVKILGEDGTERYEPLNREESALKYDVIVDDSPSSPNQKERVFQILTAMLPGLLQAGIPIPPEILDYVPLPASLTAKWKEMLQPKDGGKEGPSPEQIEAQGKMAKDQSQAQLNAAKAQTEQAKVGTEQAKAQGIGAQAAAQMARISEMTPVDEAQAQHFDAKTELELERARTERMRQETMLLQARANAKLQGERETTEEARQQSIRSQQNGADPP